MSDVTELFMKKTRAEDLKQRGEKLIAESKKLTEEIQSECEHNDYVRVGAVVEPSGSTSSVMHQCTLCGEQWSK